ncbi:MAG TPA: sodium:solute symporter [Bryobacteraceae bacterium]|jgi:SSS family transporter|nr:sodium:solute symporter [Bryobacteraceae bacterium]
MRFADLAVIAVYLVFITWFGAQFKEKQATLKDYFLGGRGAPWWAIAFSIVSAETSTLTVIGTPALSFAGNFGFLQLILGYLLGRIVIAVLFLPQYFRGEMFTAYELMQRRFGPRVRRFTAGTFLVLRALAEGVRVFAISIVISIVLGTGQVASIAVIVCLTLFYTFEGGMTAVIWTDVVQMFLYIAGALVSFFVILHLIPGGWPHVAAVAGAAGKFQVFDFRFSVTAAFFHRTYSFWAGLLGGCFLTTASHGTEQLLVQRLLSARNERESRWALFSSWAVVFAQFCLFLLIGVLLFVYYRDTGRATPAVLERTYPEFIWRHLPVGVAGLVIAAILAAAMSNLSAALNALASTTIMDFVRPLRPEHSESSYLKLSRWATVAWGVLLFAIGLVARHWGRVLEAGLSIASVLYGALLGVFLLGVLTKRANESGAIAGMCAGFAVTLLVRTEVAYTWYVLIGSAATFLVGYAFSFVAGAPRQDALPAMAEKE